jgi:hypothetical protein
MGQAQRGQADIGLDIRSGLRKLDQPLCRSSGIHRTMAFNCSNEHHRDRKLDVLLKDARTPDVPVFEVARRQGILL